jgi:outer membrane protein
MRSLLFIIIFSIFSLIAFSQDGTPAVLTFNEAVHIGLKRNMLLNQQKNQLVANQAQKLAGYGNFLPNLNLTSNYTHQNGNQQNTTTGDLENLSTDYFGTQLNANLTLFNGLRNIHTLSQSNKQVSAQAYLVKRSTQDVVSTVANQYLTVLLDQELLKIAEGNLESQRTVLEQMQGFYDAGSRAITDVLNQDAITKAAQVSFIRARNTLQNDKSILAQTLQLDPSERFEVVYPDYKNEVNSYQNNSLDSLISIALSNRSDLKQISFQVESNKSALRTTLSGYLPSLSLFANYGSFYYSLIADDFNTQFRTTNPSLSYGANLTIPLFSRFANTAQRATSKATYDNSVLSQNNLLKTVKLDVQRSHNNLLNSIEAYKSSLSQYEAGVLAMQTQKESYDLGISAQVALAQANRTYVEGAASKAQAEVTLVFQKILLDYALGTLRVEDFEKDSIKR